MQSEQINELAKALSTAQGEFPVLEKRSKAYNYMYADLAETLQATQKPLTKNGLSIVHTMKEEILITILMHESGQWISTQMPLIFKADGKINAMQALGSAITYAKRYSIGCLLNLAADKEIDDDGRATAPIHSQPKYEANCTELPDSSITSIGPDMIKVLEALFREDAEGEQIMAKKYPKGWASIPMMEYGAVATFLKDRKKKREIR